MTQSQLIANLVDSVSFGKEPSLISIKLQIANWMLDNKVKLQQDNSEEKDECGKRGLYCDFCAREI